jgi:hypothetical protein
LALAAVAVAAFLIRSATLVRPLAVLPGIEIGMSRTQVLRVLETSQLRDSVMLIPKGFSVSLKDSPFFRHAYCSFDAANMLVQITLTIREVLDQDRVMDHLRVGYGLRVSSGKTAVGRGLMVRLKANKVVISDATAVMVTARSKSGPVR